ncbi:hypothetical protein FNF27_01701 [Cafeteria roenbergensis]|uniref:Mitochondrial import inner membrane translocase subunit TIM22 n=1 Tax=Cafeteria roenbergensis TaxID=33653 RepID=A0A5A8E1L0_CAFRO|nr:hypothetical protein FNF29_03893 [Cafeteria roenbergensis]KAA0167771.1 hypothetical protein FNF31_00706 [Cafeteria roenbergensis]KAA0171686.1 hypothetical protein FNF28_00619 [Cafeteria roenbergensis]KAA0176879.1 hypothetical protein FNF27_01701 [Cafeteria roenbergensis]|eukprot:KAA0152327.1 hypothetical protein FNF29_03893 [Cafeteria roenbergensis]
MSAEDFAAMLDKAGLLGVVTKYQDHCLVRSASAAVAGVGIGIGIGTFIGTMAGAHGEISGNTLAEQLKTGFGRTMHESLRRGYAVGRSFGIAGAAFVATECSIEKWRARHDVFNAVFAGITAGAAMGAWNARAAAAPAVARAVAMNAAQFAALALAFELGSDAFAAFKAKHAA